MNIDEKYMRRALQLARLGRGGASPNPMVGAVIVADGRIIGEGYHRQAGKPHAEVNAISSVRPADRKLLCRSTLYVTLEPCSHYGKTPPCSKLIVETGIPRVVIGSKDPFKEVSGRGIAMLNDAGIETAVGILGRDCMELNRRFMTAHTRQRPYILLKWAESSDRFVDRLRDAGSPATVFSTPATLALSHRLRAEFDAIMIGANTLRSDNPSLTTRHWTGSNPLRIVVSQNSCTGTGLSDRKVFCDGLPTILFSGTGNTLSDKPDSVTELAIPDPGNSLLSICRSLYQKGITSVIVEGGPTLISGFLQAGLWDEARIEQSPVKLGAGISAPPFVPAGNAVQNIEGNLIYSQLNENTQNNLCFV